MHDKKKHSQICMHNHTYQNGAPQITGVCVATALPARKPFGSPLPVQTARDSREVLTRAHAVSCARAFQWQTCYSRRASFLVLLSQATEPTARSSDGKGVLSLGDAPPWDKTLSPSLQPSCPTSSDSASHSPQCPKHMWEWSPCPGLGEWHPVQWAGSGFVPGRSDFPVEPALKVGLTHGANSQ